jgi:hypothetical protein
VTALGSCVAVAVEGGIRDPNLSSMSSADRGEARTRPSVAADPSRSSLRHGRHMSWPSSADDRLSPGRRGGLTEGLGRVAESEMGAGNPGWRVMSFMGASLPSGRFGVVSP